MAEIKLNFISENAKIICWTPPSDQDRVGTGDFVN